MLKKTILILSVIHICGCSVLSKSGEKNSSIEACRDESLPTWSGKVSKIFEKNCNSCHSDYSSYDKAIGSLKGIEANIKGGYMPIGTPLNPSEKEAVLKWASCGGPK